MNILIINGSPRGNRSNSLKLTNAFVQGITHHRNTSDLPTTVEQINVSESHIENCKGCFACWKSTSGKCCIHDDMPRVIEKILWADVIIYSFPLYYFNIPGIMKNLIDRQLPMALPFMSENTSGIGSGSHDARYDMSGKKTVLISTCGFYSPEDNYGSVLRMFDHICGQNAYETIFCGQGELFAIKELSKRTDAYLQHVEQAGKDFAANGHIASETKVKLQELLYPKDTFEKMADASWGIDRESGEQTDESLTFTRQMAALYNKNNYDGKDRVLEICYTDLDKTYQITMTKDGSEVFTDGHLEYTTRIDTPYPVWQSIAQGEIRGDEAMAQQLYTVKGDFSLMLKWDTFFGADEVSKSKPTASFENTKKHPVMVTMLIAWITFWVAVSIHTQIGALITLGVCASIPLIMVRYETTIYDKLSASMVALLSIGALATNQGALATNAGYLLFGLLWIASCFTKEPLCACYVKYDYNGDDALKNPIFMKANYILAWAWGILYIATAIWTWFLSKSGFTTGLIILNNIIPMLMGAFTGWFSNWYPAWVARGKHK